MNLDLATRLEADIDQALTTGDLDQAEQFAQRYRSAADESAQPDGGLVRFRSRWLSAQVALAQGRLEEATRLLALLVPLPADLPEALACRIWLAFAETQARQAQHDAARRSLARAVAFREVLDQKPLLQLRELRIRLWLGEVERLSSELSACARALERQGETDNLALLLCEEGRAWDAAGRLDRAADCWRQAEQLSQGLPDVQIQQGRLEHLRGHLQAALDRYEAALACVSAPAQHLEARLRRILVLLDLNQYKQAQFEGARLQPQLRNSPPEELHGLISMVRSLLGEEMPSTDVELSAFRASVRGDLALARSLYQQAIHETNTPVRRARLALGLGMVALASADVSEARHWLALAEELARREDLPEVLWRALQARGLLAAEHDGNDDRARELLEQAVVVSERQTRQLRHRVDAVTHGLRRDDVLRRLLLAACRRGDAAAVFRYQELQRGRFLLDLWQAAPTGSHRRLSDDPRLAQVDEQIAALEQEAAQFIGSVPEALLVRREQMLLLRDRLLDDYLRDRSRASSAAIPALPEWNDLQKALSAGSLYIAPVLCDEELFLLVGKPGGPGRIVSAPGSARPVADQVQAFRRCLDGQLARYQHGFPLGSNERREIDARLEELGTGPLGDALWQVLDTDGAGCRRIIWVPDGVLHGVPVHALRRAGRYLVQTHEVVFTFGGALLVHQLRTSARRSWLRRAVVITEAPSVLPAAAREGEGVAATFLRRRLLRGHQATVKSLRQLLPGASVVHLAAHAYFDAQYPLSACIGLPSGERWRALDWLDEPLDGLPLVTLSACRSAEVGPLAGREVFGLVSGLLGAGVRTVLAGLWPIADREALPFMWRFYRHLMAEDVPTALALTQRECLAEADSSPVFWSAFAMFGDPQSLPTASWRWLAGWRQSRHARRFDPSRAGV